MNHSKFVKKSDKPLLSQIPKLIPASVLSKSIDTWQSDKHCHAYKTYDQLEAMIFGQLNKCHSLREIAQGISISPKFLKDIGLQQSPAKSTMSDSHAKRCWQVFKTIYFDLLEHFSVFFPNEVNTK